MEKYFKYFVVFLVLYLVVQTWITENRIEKQKDIIGDLTAQIKDVQRAIAVKDQPYIPDSISFFGGNVPLHIYGVWDDIDYWIRYYTSPKNRWRISYYLEKKDQYFSWLEKTLKEQNILDDAKYIPVTESELNLTVVSWAGAKGSWQFMPATARQNKLVVNNQIDERAHFEKATLAACNDLRSRYKDFEGFVPFERWMFTLASYNTGAGNVWKSIKVDGERSYFLLSSLFSETEQYIPRTIAIKLIMQNPERYGFVKGVTFGGPSVKLVVNYSLRQFKSWSQIAKEFGVSKKEIRRANPYILNKEGIPKGVYTLRIPERNK